MFYHESINLGYTTLGDASTESTRIYVTPSGDHYPSITTVLGISTDDFKKGHNFIRFNSPTLLRLFGYAFM